MRRAHIVISGLVQGVLFRAFTWENAMNLGMKGSVRNLPSGEVEVVAEGEEEKISELIEKLKAGPPAARVDDVKVEWQPYEGDFRDFAILR